MRLRYVLGQHFILSKHHIMSTTIDPANVSAVWLDKLSAALSSNDAVAVANLFVPEGWLRDMLTFTWDNRALKGRDKITTYLSDRLAPTAVSHVRPDPSPYVAPKVTRGKFNEADTVEFGFLYETTLATGQGHASLVQDSDGEWKALLAGLITMDLKGHEELGEPTLQVKEEPGYTFEEVYERWKRDVEANPTVLIGGHGWLLSFSSDS